MGFFRRIFHNDEEDSDNLNPPALEEESLETYTMNTSKSSDTDMIEEQTSESTNQSEEKVDNNGNSDDTITLEQQRLSTEGVTRPLPIFEPPPPIKRIQYAQASDQGQVRTNNQDAAFSALFLSDSADDRPDFGLFIVADGLGGHHDGEKASALASKIVSHEVIQHFYLPQISDDSDTPPPPVTEVLVSATKKANRKIIETIPDGGTTLTAVVIVGNRAYISHVGDTRIYLVTMDKIEQLTHDHSIVQRLIDMKQITQEEAETHHQKNFLYRALGPNDVLEVDTYVRKLPENGYLLMCSDGLWGLIPNDIIYQLVREATDLGETCHRLITIANQNGGTDNITAILIKLPDKE
ncbi:protein phosphatase 2C domain-containing protein [Anaerolineales bacterium]